MADFGIQDFVVLDVETTGLEPSMGDEIIEIAAQKIRGREVVGEFVKMVKGTKRIPIESQKVHGISQADVDANGLPEAEVLPQLVEFLGSSIIVAHNAAFDIGFVNSHLRRLNLPELTNRVIDTIEIAKRYCLLASYKLSNVAAFLKVPQPSAHRALVDVITTREVFFKLIERAKEKK
ncbi:MAG: 3'-5' exonuclease [Candidatus Kerfeldbacteria bacterium]|nr:3'-5' exonuclease [Candidatus Kerfeldbacteria bacterium]